MRLTLMTLRYMYWFPGKPGGHNYAQIFLSVQRKRRISGIILDAIGMEISLVPRLGRG